MMRTLRTSVGFGILIALLTTGCATSRLVSTWKDPLYKEQPRKIMVIGVAKKSHNKRIFEDEFVRQLRARGTDAVASYTVMPDEKQGDYAFIVATMKEHGADAVLISSLVNQKTVRTYVPGSVAYPPPYYSNWREYYGYGFQGVYTPGYTTEDEYAVMETNLYDAGNDRLIWSALSEIAILDSDQNQIISYIGIMVKAMVARNN